jgi:hypothetical protein
MSQSKYKKVFNVKLPDFNLQAADVNDVWFNPKKDSNSKLNDILCKRFGAEYKSAMHIDQKNESSKFNKALQVKEVTGIQVYLHCNCSIQYRLTIKISDVKQDSDLVINVFRCDSSLCQCSTLPASVREVRGEARKELKEKMAKLTSGQVQAEAIAAADEEIARGGYLQDILSSDVLGVVRHEMRSEKKLDKDPVIDLQRRAENGSIPDLVDLRTFPKFTATFITTGALELLADAIKKGDVILLLDATGGITRKVQAAASANFHHVLLLPLQKPNTELAPGQTTPECYLIPVAEMITNDSTGFIISQFLRLVRHRLMTEFGCNRLCAQIGTDFSWPNFYAILDLNGWTMKKFMKICYKAFDSGEFPEELQCATIPLSCFSHMCKNIKNDVNKCFNKRTDRRFIARLIGQIADIADIQTLDQYVKDVLTILSMKRQNDEFNAAFGRLQTFHGFGENSETENVYDSVELDENFMEFVDAKAIYRDSHFFQRFEAFVSNFKQQRKGAANQFFNEKLTTALLSKYLAYLPMWTIYLGRLRDSSFTRGNNGRVERFFQGLKEEIRILPLELRHIGLIHVADYAEFIEKRNAITVKEARMKVPGRKKSKKAPVSSHIANTTEKWGKGHKSKTRKSTTFLDSSSNNKALAANFSQC